MKKIDHLAVGQGIRFRNQKWAVTDKTEYVESSDYRETQWTLSASGNRTAYLIQSDENTAHGLEQIWIFSYPVSLDRVRYKTANGDWMQFTECDSLGVAPQTAALDDTIFTLKGQTSGQARDDDGNLVTKLTWDYYEPSGVRNLAVEVWKEDDGEYPEAYDGESIAPDEIEILEGKEVADIRRMVKTDWKGLGATIGGAVIIVFFVWSAGIPLDVCLAGAIPMIGFMRILNKGDVLVGAVGTVVALILAVVMFLLGGDVSFWFIVALSLILGIALPYALTAVGIDVELPGLEGLVWCFLPALWGVSFYMYFMYAPGPRDVAQLWAAVSLPVIIVGSICLVHYSLGKIWPNRK